MRSSQVNVLLSRQAKPKKVTYLRVRKCCGKKSCRLCRGMLKAHGPYWYRVEWDPVKRTRTTHCMGRDMPLDAKRALQMKRLISQPLVRKLANDVVILKQRLQQSGRQFLTVNRSLTQERDQLRSEIARLQRELQDAQRKTNEIEGTRTLKLKRSTTIYKNMVNKYHPDRNPGAAEVMKDVNELWQSMK